MKRRKGIKYSKLLSEQKHWWKTHVMIFRKKGRYLHNIAPNTNNENIYTRKPNKRENERI